MLQFDVSGRPPQLFWGLPLREAGLPKESRVVGIVREWSRLLVPRDEVLSDVAVFGGSGLTATVARVRVDRGIRMRLVERDDERAHERAVIRTAAPGAEEI